MRNLDSIHHYEDIYENSANLSKVTLHTYGHHYTTRHQSKKKKYIYIEPPQCEIMSLTPFWFSSDENEIVLYVFKYI